VSDITAAVDIRDAMPPAIEVECTVRVRGAWRARAARLLLWAASRLLRTEFKLTCRYDDDKAEG